MSDQRKDNIRKRAIAQRLIHLRKQDAMAYFTPQPTQEAFLRSQALYKMLNAENRGGKTAAVAADIRWTLEAKHPYQPNYPGGVYILFCPAKFQADLVWRQKLIVDSELLGAPINTPFIPAHLMSDVKYETEKGIKALKYIEMRVSGKRLYVCWSNYSEMWTILQGIKLHGAWIDENAGDENLITELAVRLRDVQTDPSCPGGGFIRWPATETKVNPAYSRMERLCLDPDEHDFELFRIPKGENIAIDAASGERAAKLMSEESAKSRIDSIGGALDVVRVYPGFSRELHTVKEEYIPDMYDNIWMIYDPGVSHPTGILLLAMRADAPRKKHYFAYFCERRTSIKHEVKWTKKHLKGRRLMGCIYDPSSVKTDKMAIGEDREQAIHLKLYKELEKAGIKPQHFLSGHNSHPPGIKKVIESLDEELILFYLEGEKIGKAVIEMEMYRGRPQQNFSGVDGVVKKDDECPDCVRYGEMSGITWQKDGANPVTGAEEPSITITLREKQMKNSAKIAKKAANRRRKRGKQQRLGGSY